MKDFQFFLIYLILVNLVAFLLFGLDKRKAQMHQWRISEKALFIPGCIFFTTKQNTGISASDYL